jgi:hypothetical protein
LISPWQFWFYSQHSLPCPLCACHVYLLLPSNVPMICFILRTYAPTVPFGWCLLLVLPYNLGLRVDTIFSERSPLASYWEKSASSDPKCPSYLAPSQIKSSSSFLLWRKSFFDYSTPQPSFCFFIPMCAIFSRAQLHYLQSCAVLELVWYSWLIFLSRVGVFWMWHVLNFL